jgi:hypothetical protein
MIKTFTPLLLPSETHSAKQEQQVSNLPDFDEPSNTCIQSILNFSKSLEVKSSAILNEKIDFNKS